MGGCAPHYALPSSGAFAGCVAGWLAGAFGLGATQDTIPSFDAPDWLLSRLPTP
jgi:hypothetical protein